MRTFKRFFPILLVLVLLASAAPAQPAGVTRTSYSLGVGTSNSQFIPGYSHAPSPPRFYFGVGTGDIGDTLAVHGRSRGEVPSIMQQQGLRDVPLLRSFFNWGWFSFVPGSRMGVIF
jgi:hypothetical protein